MLGLDVVAFFSGRAWGTANYFPGAVTPPSVIQSYSVTLNATVPQYWGRPVNHNYNPERKPTGLYLAPGQVGVVTVPSSMVGTGFQVLVGAHTVDHGTSLTRDPSKRLDRITTCFDIVSTTTTIVNPLGGGVYIYVPYLANLSHVTITVSGVIEAAYFRMTSVGTTSQTEWLRLRNSTAPWADFETDMFMMQVPRAWMYNMTYELSLSVMNDWNKAMWGFLELQGYPTPGHRNRRVLYVQPDVYIRSSAFSPGYPSVNQVFDPVTLGAEGKLLKTGGNGDQIWWTNNATSWPTEYHELGHQFLMPFFRGEVETIVNFPFCYITNRYFNTSFDVAFARTREEPQVSVDVAAQHWMVTANFRNGNEMDYSFKEQDEMKYQHRGYAKYADMARLYGWEANILWGRMEQDYYIQNGTELQLNDADDQIFRMSQAAKHDLRPLIDFWGIRPVNPSALGSKIASAGLRTSRSLFNLLMRYQGLIPANNREFNNLYENFYPGKPTANNPLFGPGWFAAWNSTYNETHAQLARIQVQAVLDKYNLTSTFANTTEPPTGTAVSPTAAAVSPTAVTTVTSRASSVTSPLAVSVLSLITVKLLQITM